MALPTGAWAGIAAGGLLVVLLFIPLLAWLSGGFAKGKEKNGNRDGEREREQKERDVDLEKGRRDEDAEWEGEEMPVIAVGGVVVRITQHFGALRSPLTEMEAVEEQGKCA